MDEISENGKMNDLGFSSKTIIALGASFIDWRVGVALVVGMVIGWGLSRARWK